ncbi:MAG: aromatic amino acid lyase [Actinomycetota bacterium]
MTALEIGAEPMTVNRLVELARSGGPYRLADDAIDRIVAGRRVVDELLRSETPVYGLNTGVGSQKAYPVEAADVGQYNRRLVRAHATRLPGPELRPEVVRGVLLLLLQQFATGHAGVSPELAELVARHASSTELPRIDAAGSVGASDLVPLSQLATWLFDRPDAAGVPQAKDALAFINSNAVSLASGAFRLADLALVMDLFDIAATTTFEGFRANLGAIGEPVNAVHHRGHQRSVAERLRAMLDGSLLWEAGQARLLQDPLSFRNVTQIHGALRESSDRVVTVWNEELNSVAVNPIVHDGEPTFSSHGNMDTTRITLAVDSCRQAVAKAADVSGERIHKLQWPNFSGLPVGLAGEESPAGGVQFLNLGHIAASLITSVKIWAQPHLLHSVGQVADGVEDTASHALHAVHDLERQLTACLTVVATEIAVAVWAIDRRGLTPSDLGAVPRRVFETVRPHLPIGTEGDAVFDVASVVSVLPDLADAAAAITTSDAGHNRGGTAPEGTRT